MKLAPENNPDFPTFEEFNELYFGNIECPDCEEGVVHPVPDFHKEIMGALENPENEYLLINLPPCHGKTTLLIRYIIWRIVGDPTIRILLISKTNADASKILRDVMYFLEDEDFYDHITQQKQNLIKDYGPFRDKPWSEKEIRVVGKGNALSPTVTALGWESQIRGHRVDLVIMDDVVNMSSNRTVESTNKFVDRFCTDVMGCAMSYRSKFIFVGTRVSPVDIYPRIKEQMNADHIYRPCILAEDSKGGEVLWKEHFPYEKATEIRGSVSGEEWNLRYQNLTGPQI